MLKRGWRKKFIVTDNLDASGHEKFLRLHAEYRHASPDGNCLGPNKKCKTRRGVVVRDFDEA